MVRDVWLTCAAVPSLKDESTAGSASTLRCNKEIASAGRPFASHILRAGVSGSESFMVDLERKVPVFAISPLNGLIIDQRLDQCR